MDFNLTEEQITFQNSVRNLADKYLKKDNLRRAHDPLFPKDIANLFSKNLHAFLDILIDKESKNIVFDDEIAKDAAITINGELSEKFKN